MKSIDALLASYLDLARHLDPRRFPLEAPPAINHRLGRFDQNSQRTQVQALRSVANALEDLEGVDDIHDEVDRTMLMGIIRTDMARLEMALNADRSNPAMPLQHLSDALFDLMGEDFDAASDAALRERVAGFPAFLASAREDVRPSPPLTLFSAQVEAGMFDESSLDLASERLDDATVQPAMVAIADHRQWLEEPERGGGSHRYDPTALETVLATLVPEPLGIKGTLRMLELRRAGVERSLAAGAQELGSEEPLVCAQRLQEEAVPDSDIFNDFWFDEWRRVSEELHALDLDVPEGEPPDAPIDAEDGWSMAGYAVRDHAMRLMTQAMARQQRPVRRLIDAPGLLAGWGRTAAALLRSTDVFGLPERRLMTSFLALRENVAAEVDLMLHAGLIDETESIERLVAAAGLREGDARTTLAAIVVSPLDTLAAALAHEAWQSWYADVGGDPVAFVRRALEAGGLSVPLARWALDGVA